MASEGKNNREITRILNISRDMARLWRNRWLETDSQELSIFQRLQLTTDKSLDIKGIGGRNNETRHH